MSALVNHLRSEIGEGASSIHETYEMWRQEHGHHHFAIEPRRGLDLVAEHGTGLSLALAVAVNEEALEERCRKLYLVLRDPEGEVITLEEMVPRGEIQGYARWIHERAKEAIERPAPNPDERRSREDRLMTQLFPYLAEVDERLLDKRYEQPTYAPFLRITDPALEEQLQLCLGPIEGQPNVRGIDPSSDHYQKLVLGPIHMMIGEPSELTFSTLGEQIDHLSIKLGYARRGVEALIEAPSRTEATSRVNAGFTACSNGLWIAERAAGDIPVTHGIAYCHAIEAHARLRPSDRDKSLRMLLLHLEQIAGCLRDISLSALDGTLAPEASLLQTAREELRVMVETWTHSRSLMGALCLGGVEDHVATSLLSHFRDGLPKPLQTLLDEALALVDKLMNVRVLHDRLSGVGAVSRNVCEKYGAQGVVARASLKGSGDALERLKLRAHDLRASHDNLKTIAKSLPKLHHHKTRAALDRALLEGLLSAEPYTYKLGSCEGSRGEVLTFLMLDPLGRPFRIKIRDPSLPNWPVLAEALTGRGVQLSDFPVIYRSFQLSVAGHDL